MFEEAVIPRKIWFLWFQGIAQAPLVVRSCAESWVKLNPAWEVIVLDENNLSQYVTLELSDSVLAKISKQLQSDLIRVHLLSRYGGVWVDATTYCARPLDEWIDACSTSGFFAFNRPGRDRLLSSWFLASAKGAPIVVRLKERLSKFLLTNNFIPHSDTKKRMKRLRLLSRLLNRSTMTTRYWFSPVVTRLFRVYPYFLFHYLFERLVAEDDECRSIWERTRKISADGPHIIQKLGLFAPATKEVIAAIEGQRIPLYKLSWKYAQVKYAPSTLLHYVLEGGKENVDNRACAVK